MPKCELNTHTHRPNESENEWNRNRDRERKNERKKKLLHRRNAIITKLGMYLQCAYESSNKLLTIFHNTHTHKPAQRVPKIQKWNNFMNVSARERHLK